MNKKGWTITFIPWEDDFGRERVYGRYETDEEKDDALKEIYNKDSGWLPEELSTVCVINDINYLLSK